MNSTLSILTLALGLSFAVPAATLPFTSVDVGGPTSIPTQVYSAAWGDYDNDGRPDLYLSTLFHTPAALFHNGTNGFTRVDAPGAATDIASRAGAVWADVDADGDLDLFIGTTLAEDDRLYLNDGGTGTFVAAPGTPWSGSAGYGQSALVADFDGDGWVDFFVPNGGGWLAEANLLVRNLGAGGFERLTTGPVVTEVLRSAGAAAADYDDDGRMDLFVANIFAGNSLFHNRGDFGFDRVDTSPIVQETLAEGAASAAWADFDNDGDLDLFVSHGQPRCFLYRNDGNGVFTALDRPPLTDANEFLIGVVFADFDNDGWLDVAIARRQAGQLLFRGTGDGQFEAVTTGPVIGRPTAANGVAVADYDLDGDLDLFFTNWEDGAPPSLYRNDSTGNGWLRVRLQGAGLSNTSGIGARVRVRATIGGRTFWQLRQIGGEDALGSQELVAHFGLGDAATAELVRIEWPSGFVQELTGVAARQLLTVTEDPIAVAGPPTLNRQTGLWEQRLTLHRWGSVATQSLRIVATGLPADVTLLNATGVSEEGPYVQIAGPADGSGDTELVLSFRQKSRAGFSTPRYLVRTGVWDSPTAPEGERLQITRTETLSTGDMLVEFVAQAGASYAVEYSDDLLSWRLAGGTVVAGGNRAHWIDHGPPDTHALPSRTGQRFYRVIRLHTVVPSSRSPGNR